MRARAMSLRVLLLAAALHLAAAKKVMLLDTQTAVGELGWETHSASGGPEEGWLEETFMEEGSGNNYRAYVVCEVDRRGVDNWLRTPFVPRGAANRLFLNVTFSMRDCSEFPHDAVTCGETFTLLYHEAASDRDAVPPWRETAKASQGYRKIDRIAGDKGRFSAHTPGRRQPTNVEVRDVPVSKAGLYFAFQDQGACTSILQVTVYYEVCPDVTAGLAWFPETAAGPDPSSVIEASGVCVDNALPAYTNAPAPRYVCKADGRWDLLQGTCVCRPGYAPNGQSCQACPSGQYSVGGSGARCERCPGHSASRTTGASSCDCAAGFYRAADEPPSAACTQPPSKPLDVKVEDVGPTSARVGWVEPSQLGGRSDLVYKVVCKDCPGGVQISPGSRYINVTSVKLSGLLPASSYMLFVYAENGVSEQIVQSPFYEVVEIKTPPGAGAAAAMSPPRLSTAAERSLAVEWSAPEARVREYHVMWQAGEEAEAEEAFGLSPAALRYTLRRLRPQTEYLVRVRAQTAEGLGAWSAPTRARTTAGEEVSNASAGPDGRDVAGRAESTGTIVLIVVGAAILLCLLCLCAVCLARRRSQGKGPGRKHHSDLDVLDYRGGGQMTPDYPHGPACEHQRTLRHTLGRKLTAPLVPSVGKAFKPYIDPFAYEDPNQALREHTNELDPQTLYIEAVILGGGESGEVHQGKLKLPGRPEELVAVKSLRPNASPKQRDEFLQEAAIMGQFHHPNVIRLVGVLTRTQPAMIVTEFMANNSMDQFLRRHDGRLELGDMLGLLRGVASGMGYLAAKGYVHRDLAARNVLVGQAMEAKISDFGLSRGMAPTYAGDEQAYHTKGGKIPVRWTAPEAITYRKYTSASDVWSFGIVVWEVTSYGERPYWDWSNQEVIKSVDNGYRLPAPMHCPPGLHGLMLDCWKAERVERPTFAVLERRLEDFSRVPDLVYAPTSTSTLSSDLYDSAHQSHQSALYPQPSLPDGRTFSPSPALRSSPHGHYGTASRPSPSRPPPPAPAQPPPLPTLEELLGSLGLAHYAGNFGEHGVSSVPALARLGIIDLMTYGIGQADSQRIQDSVARFGGPGTVPRPPRNGHPSPAGLPSVATLHAPGRPQGPPSQDTDQGYFI